MEDAIEDEEVPLIAVETSSELEGNWLSFTRCLQGPGVLACLADTDAGCLLVAAQSGARWGYSLLPLQVLLIPVLFVAQELTIRLGIYTKKGLTALILHNFGNKWCFLSTSILLVECVGAIVSEMSGIAAVARLWGINHGFAIIMAAALIIAVVFGFGYRQIEAIGISLGMFELTFVCTMFYFRPSPLQVLRGSFEFHGESQFHQLVSANIGAVIMPWMLYFQQSAIVARRLSTKQELREERGGTLLGSVLTQLVMIGTLVSLAAVHKQGKDLEDVQDLVTALSPVFGELWSTILVSAAFLGGSISAAFVVSLAATWAACEALQLEDSQSLEMTPAEAPGFYGCFTGVVVLGVAILMSGVNVVKLNVMVELLDGILMPFTLMFVFLLASSKILPQEVRLLGIHRFALGSLFFLLSSLSLTTAITGLAR